MPGCGWLPMNGWRAMPPQGDAWGGAIRRERHPGGLCIPLGFAPAQGVVGEADGGSGDSKRPRPDPADRQRHPRLDLVCRFLLQPGDTVLVDDPCYFNFLALAAGAPGKVVGVPMTPTGPDVAAFAEAAATHRPRFYLTNSGVHNPTARRSPPPPRTAAQDLAEAHDMVVVEDDIFADFEHTPSCVWRLRRARPDDPYRQLLQITVGGGALWPYRGPTRLDRRAGRPAHRDVDGGRPLAANLLHAVLTDGSYRRHVDGVRTQLARARRGWRKACGPSVSSRGPIRRRASSSGRDCRTASMPLSLPAGDRRRYRARTGARCSVQRRLAGSHALQRRHERDDRLYAFWKKAVSRPLLEPAG